MLCGLNLRMVLERHRFGLLKRQRCRLGVNRGASKKS
jgi:hypothetical protein